MGGGPRARFSCSSRSSSEGAGEGEGERERGRLIRDWELSSVAPPVRRRWLYSSLL